MISKTFNNPPFLYWVPAAFLATFIFSLAVQRFSQWVVTQWGKRETLESHSLLSWRRKRTTLWLALAIVFLLLALAEPVLPSGSRAVGKALNFVVVLDNSKSMMAEDYPGEISRIAMARQCLLNLYESYPKGAAGFVLFTNQANSYMVTTDRKVLRYLTLHATVKGEGSALNVGLGAALGLIKDSPEKVRTIIVLSDGGNDHPAEVWEQIPLMVEDGIRLIAAGLGGDESVRIPNRDPETNKITGYHRLKNGTYASTKLDEGPLAMLAEITGGDYVRITNGDELAQVVAGGNYATDVLLETGEESLVKYPLTAMLVMLLVWVVDKRFFQG